MKNVISIVAMIAFLGNVAFSQCGICTITNPAVLPSPIPAGTIVCITTNMTYGGITALTGGQINVCSGATLTLNGATIISATSQITMDGCSSVNVNGAVWNLNPLGLSVVDNCNCPTAFTHTGILFGFPLVCAPLPVELISFSAKKSDSGAEINWTTASESNNSHFILERSVNANEWEEVKRVAGMGNSNELVDYKVMDNHLANGTYYYRLTQVDYNGEEKTFDMISISINGSFYDNKVVMYPNPAADDLYIQLIGENTGSLVNIEVVNFSGTILMSKICYTDQSGQQHIDISGLEAGLFMVRISSDTYIESTKLIVSK